MTMKLHFDANQEYQLEAIEAAADLFDGQQTTSSAGLLGGSTLGLLQNERGVGNLLQLEEAAILENLRRVQKRGGLDEQGEMKGMHFTVEMETGTGKTYVYLRTIFELHRRYGFAKFVIVVPGKAIREGVLKSLDITREHLRALYGNPPYSYFAYNPKRPAELRAFATGNALTVMLINIESFNTEDNVIRKANDRMGGVPLEMVRQTRPIVIVDEPQNMETDVARAAIDSLNPLCTLRYSATHRDLYNQIYRLGPVQAYDKGLVKRIEVASVREEGSNNDAYVKLIGISATKTTIKAKLEIEAAGGSGMVEKKRVEAAIHRSRATKPCDLFELSGNLPAYRDGFVVSRIDADAGEVGFENGVVVSTKGGIGEMNDEIMRQQMADTIREHFDKMLRFSGRKNRVKVLSLFFIDRVANYRDHERGEDGKFALWFEELYESIRKEAKYEALSLPDATKAHDGYFSKDKKGALKDTRGTTSDDRATYELIMRDKERLLSPDEPLQFIFSHSALREGWDNPNVFQICTFNETQAYVKKRQEIGRGLRLAVHEAGERVFDPSVNVLTVIANESYDTFARALQAEIEAETGEQFGGRIKKREKRRKVRLKKGWKLDERFLALWERIKHRTRYAVELKRDDLIEKAGEAISRIVSHAPRIRTDIARLAFDAKTGIITTVRSVRSGKTFAQSLPVPDALGYIAGRTGLKLETIAAILTRGAAYERIRSNPQYMMDAIVQAIRETMQRMIVDGVKYERIAGAQYEMKIFENAEIESYIDDLRAVQDQGKTLYDHVVCDSIIESNFAGELEARDEIEFYMKLPPQFKIDTPLGAYNPDWAIVFKGDRRLYLVVETKGSDDIEALALPEKLKILSGGKHFAAVGEAVYMAPVKDMEGLTTRLQGVK